MKWKSKVVYAQIHWKNYMVGIMVKSKVFVSSGTMYTRIIGLDAIDAKSIHWWSRQTHWNDVHTTYHWGARKSEEKNIRQIHDLTNKFWLILQSDHNMISTVLFI